MTTILDRPTIKTQGPATPGMENARGFRADFGDWIQSSRPAQINSRGFVAEAASVGAIGEGVQNFGGALDQISSKMADAINTRKVLEAEAILDEARNDIAAEIAKYPQNPEKWEEIAATRTAALEKDLLKDDLSPDARTAIEARALKWRIGTQGEVKMARTRQEFTITGQEIEADYVRALDVGDYERAALRVQQLSEYRSPDTLARMEVGIKNTQLAKGNELAENRYKAAVMTGSEADLDAALQVGKEVAGWDEDFLKVKRLAGIEGIERTKMVNQSRIEAETLGDLAMRRAKGEVIAPSQIEGLVKEGKIDEQTGARMMVVLQSEQGAMQEEFYDFLNNAVDAYDSKDDPDGVKAYELQKEAAKLGLNQQQFSFFQARLERAGKMSAPQRAQQAVLNTGKKVIGEMLKDMGQTRAWDSDAETLLKDPAKLEAFGIPKEKAQEIQKLTTGSAGGWFSAAGKDVDKAKALQLFKAQAATRVAAKPDGLTDAEWNKMLTLSTDDVATDPNAAISNEFNRAILEEGLENWYENERNKRGVPPSEQEVKAWVGDKTKAVIQGAKTSNIFKSADAVPPAAGGGGVSLRGFTDAPDLAEKLPDGLAPYASTFIEAARANGLNPYTLAAISMHETANGTSKAFREKKNAMGISDASGPRSMTSVEDSIKQMAKVLAGKTYAGASSLEQVGRIYAPVGAGNDPKKLNSYWPGGVAANYARLID